MKLRTLGLLASGVLAAVLIVGLVHFADLPMERFRGLVNQLNAGALVLVVATTLAHMFIGGWKWQLVTRWYQRDLDRGLGIHFYTLTTCYGSLLGHFLPMHLTVMAARSFALRMQAKASIGAGAATSLVEQVFDLVVPVLLLLPAAALIFGVADLTVTAVAAALLLVGFAALLGASGPSVVLWLVGLIGTVKGWFGMPSDRQDDALLGRRKARRLLLSLYGLSLVRFANLVLLSVAIAWALGLPISGQQIFVAMPIVQLSFAVPITPGSLGVAEWTWSTALVLQGVGPTVAGEYALASRLLIIAAVVVSLAILCLPILAARLTAARPLSEGRS